MITDMATVLLRISVRIAVDDDYSECNIDKEEASLRADVDQFKQRASITSIRIREELKSIWARDASNEAARIRANRLCGAYREIQTMLMSVMV
jgi:hypothetical protein